MYARPLLTSFSGERSGQSIILGDQVAVPVGAAERALYRGHFPGGGALLRELHARTASGRLRRHGHPA